MFRLVSVWVVGRLKGAAVDNTVTRAEAREATAMQMVLASLTGNLMGPLMVVSMAPVMPLAKWMVSQTVPLLLCCCT